MGFYAADAEEALGALTNCRCDNDDDDEDDDEEQLLPSGHRRPFPQLNSTVDFQPRGKLSRNCCLIGYETCRRQACIAVQQASAASSQHPHHTYVSTADGHDRRTCLQFDDCLTIGLSIVFHFSNFVIKF